MHIVGQGSITQIDNQQRVRVDIVKTKDKEGLRSYTLYIGQASIGIVVLEKVRLLSDGWLGSIRLVNGAKKEVSMHAPSEKYGAAEDSYPYPKPWSCINICKLENSREQTYKGVGRLLVQIAYEVALKKFEGRIEVHSAAWRGPLLYYQLGFRCKEKTWDDVIENILKNLKSQRAPNNFNLGSYLMYLPQTRIEEWRKIIQQASVLFIYQETQSQQNSIQ